MTRIFTWLLFLFVALSGIAFSVPNTHSVQLNYYFGSITVQLSLLVILSVFAGAFVGMLSCFFRILKLQAEKRCLSKAKQKLEKENTSLRLATGSQDK